MIWSLRRTCCSARRSSASRRPGPARRWPAALGLARPAASSEAALSWLVMRFPATRVMTAVASMAASSHTRSEASRRSTGFQPVADAPQRGDPDGAAELLPQADDVHVDGFLAHETGPPGLIEQLVAGERAAGAGHQGFQQVELPSCQVHRGAGDGARPAARVQFHGARPQRAVTVGKPAGPAQVGPDPGDHLVWQERLDHVVVGASSRPATRLVSSPRAVSR